MRARRTSTRAKAAAARVPGHVHERAEHSVHDAHRLDREDEGSRAAISALFTAAGVQPTDRVVTYCHVGQQASLLFLAAKYVGSQAEPLRRLVRGLELARRHADRRAGEEVSGSVAMRRRVRAGLLPLFVWFSRAGSSLVPRLRHAPRRFASGAPRGRDAGSTATTGRLRDRLTRAQRRCCCTSGERADYDAGHIPGARFLPYDAISTRRGDGSCWRFRRRERSRLAARVARRIGRLADRAVLVEGLVLADDARLPDARLSRARATGRRSSTAASRRGRRGRSGDDRDDAGRRADTLTMHPRSDVIVDAKTVRAAIGDARVAIVDARDPRFYTGEAEGMHAREGHVPGARNLPFNTLIDDRGAFRSRATLERLLDAAGATPDKRVIGYCHIGQQATVVYFAARLLGRDVRLYDGSWDEWSQRTGDPVETGGGTLTASEWCRRSGRLCGRWTAAGVQCATLIAAGTTARRSSRPWTYDDRATPDVACAPDRFARPCLTAWCSPALRSPATPSARASTDSRQDPPEVVAAAALAGAPASGSVPGTRPSPRSGTRWCWRRCVADAPFFLATRDSLPAQRRQSAALRELPPGRRAARRIKMPYVGVYARFPAVPHAQRDGRDHRGSHQRLLRAEPERQGVAAGQSADARHRRVSRVPVVRRSGGHAGRGAGAAASRPAAG